MTKKDEPNARVFSVETRFQKLARRPGGIPREQALENAQQKIEAIRPSFDEWLNSELEPLSAAVNGAKEGNPASDWIETANLHSAQIRDAGTTMGSELLTFIAGSLCDVLDAVTAGAECNMESITCHLDALYLARQRQFRGLKPEQVPELTRGLRRVVEVVNTTPN
jgi:hypothetical protein